VSRARKDRFNAEDWEAWCGYDLAGRYGYLAFNRAGGPTSKGGLPESWEVGHGLGQVAPPHEAGIPGN